MNLTLHGATPAEVISDVYFQPDFVALHAGGDPVDGLSLDRFRHAAAVRPVPGTDLEDMETPWGYGGPIALDEAAFWQGLGLWRQRQADNGRVAEFIRLHPFLNPLAVRGWLDQIRFDRLTVLVDLRTSTAERWRHYSKGTKYCLRQAGKRLTVRPLEPTEADVFRHCYEAGLDRNAADSEYYFAPDYFDALLAAPWSDAWVAEDGGEPIAAACFLSGGPFAHYHLSGGTDAARDQFAHYLLLEHAIETYADLGHKWMHCGGGRTAAPDDPLLAFKTRFSSWRIPFYTGGMVFDHDTYERLGPRRNDRFLGYRFPALTDDRETAVTLRAATAEDFAAYYRLKCDVDNIVWSGHATPPDYHGLSQWFRRIVTESEARQIFIAEADGQRIGYIYIDDLGDSLETSIGIATSEAGRGIGRTVLKWLVNWLAADGETRPVGAWIFPENIASVKAFESAGFVRDARTAGREFEMPLVAAPTTMYRWVHEPKRAA